MSPFRSLAASAALLALAACARGPGLGGPEAAQLFLGYSGSWVLDASASGNVPPANDGADPAARERTAAPPRGGPARLPGFGGLGGDAVPAYPGRGGLGPVSPQAARATRELASHRPPRIRLQLSDSLFVAEYDGAGRTAVPMSGDEVELGRPGWPTHARVDWKGGQPALRWRLEEGGHVRDSYELLPSGRLLVTRTFSSASGSPVEVRFFYSRETVRAALP